MGARFRLNRVRGTRSEPPPARVVDRWVLQGEAPDDAVGVEVRTPEGHVYRARVSERCWEVELRPDEQAWTVTVKAIAADGRVLADERSLLREPEPPQRRPGTRWWLRIRRGGAGRGMVTYGPD